MVDETDHGAVEAKQLDVALADVLRAQLQGIGLFDGDALDRARVDRWKRDNGLSAPLMRWTDETLRQLSVFGHLQAFTGGYRVVRPWRVNGHEPVR